MPMMRLEMREQDHLWRLYIIGGGISSTEKGPYRRKPTCTQRWLETTMLNEKEAGTYTILCELFRVGIFKHILLETTINKNGENVEMRWHKARRMPRQIQYGGNFQWKEGRWQRIVWRKQYFIVPLAADNSNVAQEQLQPAEDRSQQQVMTTTVPMGNYNLVSYDNSSTKYTTLTCSSCRRTCIVDKALASTIQWQNIHCQPICPQCIAGIQGLR